MKHTRVVSTKCTPGFACRAFSDTTLVCFIVNEHTTKCSSYIIASPGPCVPTHYCIPRALCAHTLLHPQGPVCPHIIASPGPCVLTHYCIPRAQCAHTLHPQWWVCLYVIASLAGLDIKHLVYMPIGHVLLKFFVPSQYLYKSCKAHAYCWKNKHMPRLKIHLPCSAHSHKSLCALGQDLHAQGLNADPRA